MSKSSEGNYKYYDAYRTIHDMIIHHEVLPRQVLSENGLSKELGISRTPIHNALLQLAHEGLVEHIPDKGMVVSKLRLSDLPELAEIRIPLECLSASLCANRITNIELGNLSRCFNEYKLLVEAADGKAIIDKDNEFHILIADAAKNLRLRSIIQTLLDGSARIAFIAAKDTRRHPQTVEQHTAILDAIAHRDSVAAAAAMERHLTDWVDYTQTIQQENYYLFR